ncbi:MAG: rRNA maturation RNase YbeY [Clostridiales bacterium]|nr:rRNA maturation RNase YbeY [Clostridiales bacterium]
MSKFVIDGEGFTPDRLKEFEEALGILAESDCPLTVELSLVDEEEIQTLNRTYRNCDRVTDVLSFPAMDGIKGKVLRAAEHPFETDEEGRLFLGSIAICTARAKEQAEEYGHSFERELYYLAVHGILHCLGYDHEEENDKKEMRAREEEVMQKLNLTREEE